MAFPDDWNYQLAITIDNTKIDSDLSNWTLVFDQAFNAVLTSINGPLDADGTQPMLNGGGDIRFSSDEAGANELAVDVRAAVIDNTPANAELEIAVNIPAVSSSGDTIIYMWWGAAGESLPAANSTYGQYNAYDANHVIVMDMRSWVDRTSNQVDFDTTSLGTPTVNNSGSNIGRYGNFVDAARRTSANISHGIGSGTFTFESLVMRTGIGYHPSECISANGWMAPALAIEATTNLGLVWTGSHQSSLPWPDLIDYHHIVVYRSGTTLYFYFDGAAYGTASKNSTMGNSYHTLGASAPGSYYPMRGRINEYRFHNTNRSEAWIKANNYNFQNTSGFITWGSIVETGGISGNISQELFIVSQSLTGTAYKSVTGTASQEMSLLSQQAYGFYGTKILGKAADIALRSSDINITLKTNEPNINIQSSDINMNVKVPNEY